MHRRRIHFLPILIICLTGVGGGFGLLAQFNDLVSIFGFHFISVISILVACLVDFMLMFWAGGRLADHAKHPVVWLLVVYLLTGGCLLLRPVWLPLMTRFILGAHGFDFFGFGLLRSGISAFLLLPVVAGLSLSLVVFTRQQSAHIGQSGSRFSIVSGTLATSFALALPVAKLLVIPLWGIATAVWVAGILIVLAGIFGMSAKDHHSLQARVAYTPVLANRVRKTALAFRKSVTVMGLGASLTRAVLRVHFVMGFVAASAAVIYFRLVAALPYPFLPESYLSVVFVVFAGAGAGAFFFRFFAGRSRNSYLALTTLCMLYAFFSLLSLIVYRQLLPVFIPQSQPYDIQPVQWTRLLGMTAFLAFVPSFTGGIFFPLIAKIYPKRISRLGTKTAKLWFLFLMGGAFGMLVCSFALIPAAGLTGGFYLVVLLPILCAIYLLWADSRLIRGFRAAYALGGLVLYMGLAFFAIQREKRNAPLLNQGVFSSQDEGYSARIAFHLDPDSSLQMSLNGKVFSGNAKREMDMNEMAALLPSIAGGVPDETWLMGLGTGVTARVLAEVGAKHMIIFEPHPEVVRAASGVFADYNNNILTDNRVDIHMEDIRAYLNRTDKQAGLIVSDVSCAYYMPGYYTVEFYALCRQHLLPGGMLCQVLPGKVQSSGMLAPLLAACAGSFRNISVWQPGESYLILLAWADSPETDREAVRNRMENYTTAGYSSLKSFGSYADLAKTRLYGQADIFKFVASVRPLSDSRPASLVQ